MAATAQGSFVVDAIDLDGVAVSHDDGYVVAARDLTDDSVSMEDILEAADEHDLSLADVRVDMQDGEARAYFGGGGD